MNDAARRALRATKIGFVFQDFALLEYLSARENILFPYRIAAGIRIDARARARAEQLALSCGLEGKLDRRPGALSQGEQQRVALCRALRDEPSARSGGRGNGQSRPCQQDGHS